jgi:16S rRNA G966 N2-methylase RsmD
MEEQEKARGGLSRAALRLANLLPNALRPEPDWVKKKRKVDAHFDLAHGVDTGGITDLKRLHVVGDRTDSVAHIASDPEEFGSALAGLGIHDFSAFTFIDLGAGKGRALLLAARRGFKRIVGVEFARQLVEVAQRNVRAAGPAVSGRTSIVQHDAGTYQLPDEPIVLFMYNPFGAKTMAAVARRVRESFERNPRPLHVVYVVPEHLQAWTQAGFVAQRRDHYAILRPAAASPAA